MEHAKAAELGLLDIGAAAKKSGVSAKMIRHYESIGLLAKAARTAANYRVYRPADIHTLRFIKRARTLGFSIEDIRQLVGLWQNRSRSSAAVKSLSRKHVQGLKQRIGEMQSVVDALEHLAKHCHGDDRPECPILDDLSGS
jgi:Cu(I)-responsive transcriptional regulator